MMKKKTLADILRNLSLTEGKIDEVLLRQEKVGLYKRVIRRPGRALIRRFDLNDENPFVIVLRLGRIAFQILCPQSGKWQLSLIGTPRRGSRAGQLQATLSFGSISPDDPPKIMGKFLQALLT